MQRSGTCLHVRASRHPVLAVPLSVFLFPTKFAPPSTLHPTRDVRQPARWHKARGGS